MNNLEGYKSLVFDFEKNQDTASYEERVGPPKELPAVIGMISLNFQSLENELSDRITQMIGLGQEIGEILTAELPFKNKVNLFASLYYELKGQYNFNSLPGFEEGYFKELLKALTKCEELRNQILHSDIVIDWKTNEMYRRKVTAKAKRGLTRINQKVHIPYLFNVADYIFSMIFEINEFFIDFKNHTMKEIKGD